MLTPHTLEILGLIATPLLAFAGSWGGIKARLGALDRRITESVNAANQRMNEIDKRIDRTDGDVRELRKSVVRIFNSVKVQ